MPFPPLNLLFLESLNKLISETMIRWAQESEIEKPELVRTMFTLLHRQYEGLKGQMEEPLSKAYMISQASVGDTVALLSSLCEIRSLLGIRMGKEEEQLMIRSLGSARIFLSPNCLSTIDKEVLLCSNGYDKYIIYGSVSQRNYE